MHSLTAVVKADPASVRGVTVRRGAFVPPLGTNAPARHLGLARRQICAADSAVGEERRGGDEARLVAGEEERGVGDLGRLAEAAHRDVDEALGGALRVCGEELLKE